MRNFGNRVLKTVLHGLKIGEVSKVFEFGDSWAIVKLEDKREAGPAPLDKVYDKIYRALTEKITRQKEEDWFKKALKENLILDANQQAIPLSFFYPNDPEILKEERERAKKTERQKKDKGEKGRTPSKKTSSAEK